MRLTLSSISDPKTSILWTTISVSGWSPGFPFGIAYKSSTSRAGSSKHSLTRTKKVTASRPSTSHRPHLDPAGDRHRPFLDLVHAENAGLRRVEDRRRHQRAVDAAIGNGERAAQHFLDLERAVAGAAAEIGDGLLDLAQRFLIAVAHHRHDQAALRADRNADVTIIFVDDVGAVDLGIDRGNFLERLHAGAHEKSHEAELHAVLLLEQIAVLRA